MLHKIIAVYIIDVILAINHLVVPKFYLLLLNLTNHKLFRLIRAWFYEKNINIVNYQFPLTLLTTG